MGMLLRGSSFRLALCLVCYSAIASGQSALDVAVLESAAKRELAATRTPGAVIGVVKDGRLIYTGGIGTSNIETGAPVTPEMLFRLGSTTKMLTATAVSILAAEGKLDFADPVGKHIQGLDPAIAALTVDQVLSHTAGLKDTAVMHGRHDDSALGEEIRKWKADWLFTKPGAIYSYANPGYWLAGFLAESTDRKPYADVMQERVFGPLSMASSTLRPTMAMTRPLSQGHEEVNQKVTVMRPAADNAANWPAGSVFSNVADLSRFVIALMNDGKLDGKVVLAPKVVTALTTPHADIPGSPAKYGYGLNLEDRGGVRVWSHGGSRAGYGSFISMLPERKSAVIVLCNRTGMSLPRTVSRIMLMLGAPERPPAALAETAIPAGDFWKYIGSYRNGETTSQIVERDGKLFFRSLELRKGEGGWLLMKKEDGSAAGRIFTVAGADGRVQYLHLGERSAARVM